MITWCGRCTTLAVSWGTSFISQQLGRWDRGKKLLEHENTTRVHLPTPHLPAECIHLVAISQLCLELADEIW